MQYSPVYNAYASQFDRERLFTTHDKARAHDLAMATRIVSAKCAAELDHMLKGASADLPQLRVAVALIHDQLQTLHTLQGD